MDATPPQIDSLLPLAYHGDVVAYLRAHEPDVWAWASSQKIRAEYLDEIRAQLLRDTYRIEASAHPEVHAALALAMQRLCITAPATLYQSAGQAMNAALLFVPGEVHVILQGPVLERLSTDELVALFGHELSHYVLWSRDGGQFHVADRILNDAIGSSSSPSHHETARRYFLHTELFADRGGAIAAAAIGPAVSTLVKVQTGMATVDAAAYLRQAGEIDGIGAKTTSATTHPETFIRARALELWWTQADALQAWLDAKLRGPLSLQRLDVLDQLRLQCLSRGFIRHFLDDPALRTGLVLSQVRSLFPDWDANESAAPPERFDGAHADDSVRDYLNALMLDLALADDDVRDAAILHAARTAQSLGSLDALHANLKRDARFGKRDLDRLARQLAKAPTP